MGILYVCLPFYRKKSINQETNHYQSIMKRIISFSSTAKTHISEEDTALFKCLYVETQREKRGLGGD